MEEEYFDAGIEISEGMTTDTEAEPRYSRFAVRYPSGTVIESRWTIEGGGTLREVQVEHPLAIVDRVLSVR